MFRDKQRGRKKALVDGEVRAGGMFGVPFVWIRVAPVNKLYPVPLEDEADRPIETMNGGDAANNNVVFIVDHLVDSVERKLVDLELSATKVNDTAARADVSLVHLVHFFHAVLGAEFRL